jgi:hypothetical protein
MRSFASPLFICLDIKVLDALMGIFLSEALLKLVRVVCLNVVNVTLDPLRVLYRYVIYIHVGNSRWE